MSGDLCMLTAVEAVALLRSGRVSSRELVAAALQRIEAVDAQLNALPTVCAERALERAARVSRDAPLAGLAMAVKDLNDGRRRAQHAGLADLRRPRARPLRPAGRAAGVSAARWSWRSRTRPSSGPAATPSTRCSARPEPVGHVAHLRRVVGWLGGRAGRRPGVAGDRIRPRRQRSHPGRVLRRRGGPSQPRPGGRRPLAAAVRDDVGGGADGPHRGRRRADAGRDGRPRRARPAVAGGAGAAVRRGGGRAGAARAGRLTAPTSA